MADARIGSRQRRRSLTFFSRPGLSALTPIHADGPNESPKGKKQRPQSFLVTSTSFPSSLSSHDGNDEQAASPTARPKTLIKAPRPTSIFGSLRGAKRPTEDEEKLTRRSPTKASAEDEPGVGSSSPVRVVQYHGEVQTAGGMFRKRKEYLVLTDTHLLRFKNLSKAHDAFPSLPAPSGRTNSMRHTSMGSVNSMPDLQSVHSQSSADNHFGIPLHQIVAVYMLEDGRPYFSIEVAFLDDETSHASAMILQLSDPAEAEAWLKSIRSLAIKARLQEPHHFSEDCVTYIARKLEQERDYDGTNLKIFKVIQRATNKSPGRSSTDDLAKLASNICYLVIGAHKVHLVPLRKPNYRSSSTSLAESSGKSAFGLMTLTAISTRHTDDAFELIFREPFRQAVLVPLASSASADIAIFARQAVESLRPEWIEQPFMFKVPQSLEESILPISTVEEDYRGFDRTLTAYSAAYSLNTSNIRYAITFDDEDAPRFTLLPPADTRTPNYSVLELLAVLRALRYNESFSSISFRGISLSALHQLRDSYGWEHAPWTTRSGMPLAVTDYRQKSLLIQEIQAIALKSKKLRRVDFTSCFARAPREDDSGTRDPGCEIAEALFPLCKGQLTNIDWITLNGIELGDRDLDYLVDAAVERRSHLRALEISHCGLTERSLQIIWNAMGYQSNTLESIDLSGNLARLSPSTFHTQIAPFSYIRKLNLSQVKHTATPEPLVPAEILFKWRLEELHMSETEVNEQTLDALAAYMAVSASECLRVLSLNQCGLTGKDVALLLHAMSRDGDEARSLHLFVSENKLNEECDLLADAIAKNHSPSHMTMKMIDFKETRFRALIQAVTVNTRLKYLDISKASLEGGDAREDTCEAMKRMFAENKTLEELDISGEHAHLEVAKFGIGLNHALTGLKKNKTLRVLRIEYQNLGLQGADTLSDVLAENTELREIYCENNDINLQGLTGLLNGLAENKTLMYLPRMESDRKAALRTVEREVQGIRAEPQSNSRNTTIRRSIAAITNTKTAPSSGQTLYSENDVRAAIMVVDDKWAREIERMERYLARNYKLAHGIPLPATDGENERPMSAMSLMDMRDILQHVVFDSTPTVEKTQGLEAYGHGQDRKGREANGTPTRSRSKTPSEDGGTMMASR